MKGISCFVFAVQVFLGCNMVPADAKGETTKSLDSSVFDFSVDILKVVARNEGSKLQKNIIMSPTNIFRALLLVYAATSSNTRAQLDSALHMDNSSTNTIKNYLRRNSKPSKTLLEAERLYIDESVNVKKTYEEIVSNGLKKVDMSGEKSKVIAEVNNFVKNITNGMITNVLKESWTPLGNSIFISAIYFKSNWHKSFQKQTTSKQPFFTNEGSKVTTDMMFKKDSFEYNDIEILQSQVISMEYKDNPYTMLVFLPKENGNQTVDTLISQLTPSLIKDAYKSLEYREVHLHFPKFKADTEILLKDIFVQLGVKDLFTPEADFSVMTDKKMQLADAVHGAKINLDEEGTEAAAYTMMRGGLSLSPHMPQPIVFCADRPFLYMIYDINKHIPVFMGVMVNPTQ